MRRLLLSIWLMASASVVAATRAPEPRELVHPYPPTGPLEVTGVVAASKVLRTVQRYAMPPFTDLLALHVAQTLQADSDRRVQVTRRHRQHGNEAIASVSSAAADGRTLLLAGSPAGAASAQSRPFLPGHSLRPVALIANMPYVLVAGAESAFGRIGEVTAAARAAPDTILIATPGQRSEGHTAIELLRSRFARAIEPLAYNGGTAALKAVAGQEVNVAFVPLPAVLSYLGSGRIKALAIAAPHRHPGLPQVETAAEAGIADFEAISWFGVFAPMRTPAEIVRDLNAILARSAQSEQDRRFFSELGVRLEHRQQ
jgi:tripartite-type tricarboxylate transporter receptor subunit TctC